MSRTIFLVVGSAGEYSDYGEWVVKAFTSKVRAQTFADFLNEYIGEVFKEKPEDTVRAEMALAERRAYYAARGFTTARLGEMQLDVRGATYTRARSEIAEYDPNGVNPNTGWRVDEIELEDEE